MTRFAALLLTVVLSIALLPTGAAAQVVAPAGFDADARRAAALLPRATTVNDRDADKQFDDLQRAFLADPGARQPVIVLLVAGVDPERGRAAVLDVAPDARVRSTFHIVPVVLADLTAEEAQRVAGLAEVRQLELDRPGTPELDQATGVMGADTAVDELGVSGDLDGDPSTVTRADVGIAILDSGFHAGHEQLDRGKLTAFVDLGSGRVEPYDDNGHGTHVANIAAGWGAGSPQHRGVAPGAGIIGIKIEGGSGSASNALAGFQWLVQHREDLNIRVATISYGFGTATDGTTALELAVDAAWDAGIVVFKSNGNSGPANRTMTVPAAARGIIAMGSLIDPFGSSRHGFSLSTFSSRGPTTDGRIKPDLTAPGDGIMAAATGTRAGYTSKSGTSMASPFGAGTAALVIAADPTLTPDGVRDLLFATAEDFGAAGPDNDFGHGRIQVAEAVRAALEGAGRTVPPHTPPAVPVHEGRVITAGVTGVATTTVQVTSPAHPLAVTALGQSGARVLGVDVAAGSSALPGLGIAVNTGAHRHGYDSVSTPAPGTYTVTVLTEPFAQVAVAISHSVAG